MQAFVGIGLKLQDAEECISRAIVSGAPVLLPFNDYHYAASLVPDEDEMKTTPVRYGKVSDPDGYCVEVTAGGL